MLDRKTVRIGLVNLEAMGGNAVCHVEKVTLPRDIKLPPRDRFERKSN